MSVTESGSSIQLPPGVTIASRRETSQSGPNGIVVKGMDFTLQLTNGATTSVFVPYAQIGNLAAVATIFQQRIDALDAIDALQG